MMKKLSLNDLFTLQDINRLVDDIVRNGQLTGIYTNKNAYVTTKPYSGKEEFDIKEIEKEVEVLIRKKLMNVKFTLWDAVEQNKQIELLLISLEEKFKELKQKGYKTNINVQEKIKEINKWVSALLEEQSKLTKEEKEMKVVTAEDISRIFIEMEKKYGKDKAIGIFVGKTQESVRLIDGKGAVQILFEKLQEYEDKEKEPFEYRGYTLKFGLIRNPYGKPQEGGSCEELKYATYSKSREQNITNFKLAVDFCLDCKNMNIGEEEKKGEGKDVELVEQFHLELKKVFKDMNTVPLITHPQRELIQTVKLSKVYELYKDSMRLSTFESFVKYYFSNYKYLNQ